MGIDFQKDKTIDALIAWARDNSGVPKIKAVWDRQNQPRPKGPKLTNIPRKQYISLNFIIPLQKLGSRDSQVSLGDDQFQISGLRSFTLRVIVYGEERFDADAIAIRLQDSFENPLAREPLRKAGLAVWDIGDILDVSALIESGYEQRRALDLRFGIGSSTTVKLPVIEKIEVTGTVDGIEEPKKTIS